ncbi:MAG: DUF192 domain-containing protein [Deltaproteobacteria bacterium]|nr:MAG: DUF192 domain-containing protein [Deltaproteobacteria bacterium]
MKVVNMTRSALLGDGVETARTPLERTRGLLGATMLPRGGGLWIVPCRSIHSFGMRYEFDAVFIDLKGRVVGLHPRFRRNRISRIFWSASGVLELSAGTIERTWTALGDEVVFQTNGGRSR